MFSYRGEVEKILRRAAVKVGDKIKVVSRRRAYIGVLMPRTELGDPNHLVLKLANGYNIGVKVDRDTEVTLLESQELPELAVPKPERPQDPSKPRVTIVGTGGTIASRVDYRTGAVYPAFTPEDIYGAVPEIAEIANIKVVQACNVFSEHMTPDLWVKIARVVAKEINGGATGVVVAHGTDTMSYTAAALSFMLKGLFRPVVLVGSQRSSDRPSSDAALNLISAVAVAARSDIAEVVVVMHGSTEDDFCLIHRGTKVRKCHTSRRDAFQSINDIPLGMVRNGQIKLFRDDYHRASSEGRVRVQGRFEKKVALLKATPGLPSSVIKGIVASGDKGIVIEGTGLGHAPQSLFEGIEFAGKRKVPVVMTSQCLWGRVNMNVYSTGRDLLQLGVIPAEDMLPEVAWVKLMWVLGRTKDPDKVAKLMQRNLTGEITPRTRPDVFLKTIFTSE
ncbi:MAG: Glu-tRNA(Gln) amidotransferase subunit GatD [Candidatus Hadarchaeum sp.]|uniref:Glu-tRNA(Gln) amidotransferase subunit GatD n=1 Tax=Candidatus Hadarchaeum sp. TaxID=2883567 RepID=UPI0031736C71